MRLAQDATNCRRAEPLAELRLRVLGVMSLVLVLIFLSRAQGPGFGVWGKVTGMRLGLRVLVAMRPRLTVSGFGGLI